MLATKKADMVGPARVGPARPSSQNATRQYQLATPLPINDFLKAAVTDAMRTEMGQSRDAFRAASTALRAQRDILAGFGVATPLTDELFSVTNAAARLLSHLDGKFSGPKKAGLRTDHGIVSAAELGNLITRATNEIRDLYPIAHMPQGNTLNKKLKGIFIASEAAGATIPITVPRILIRAADAQDRADAAGNERLLDKARNQINRVDFELYVIELGVVQQGTVEQTSAVAADELIRTQMQTWAPGADIGGRRIAGNVAILKGHAWQHLILSIFSRRLAGGLIKDLIQTANAFERDGRVYINADRGNAGTMIHEGVHKYAPNAFLDRFGEPLNEGVTEYFARQICLAQNPPIVRTQYPDNVLAAEQLVADAGEDNVRAAYFLGNVAALDGVAIPVVP
jgi:hypothetical protein